MLSLIGNENFRMFIESIRDARETTIRDAFSDTVVSNERMSMAAAGAIRTYSDILDTYDELLNTPPPPPLAVD
jgi:hypothetical protein